MYNLIKHHTDIEHLITVLLYCILNFYMLWSSDYYQRTHFGA